MKVTPIISPVPTAFSLELTPRELQLLRSMLGPMTNNEASKLIKESWEGNPPIVGEPTLSSTEKEFSFSLFDACDAALSTIKKG